MTRERRVVLILLGVTVFLSGFGSLLLVGLDRLHSVENQIDFLGKQYAKLQAGGMVEQVDLQERIRELTQAEDAELGRYYEKEEMDLYRFGSAVSALLARHAITVEQFRTASESQGPVLQLTAWGTSSSFMAFLSEVFSGRKYWTIPFLHIQSQSGNGSLTCEFQIGYMVHETEKKAP